MAMGGVDTASTETVMDIVTTIAIMAASAVTVAANVMNMVVPEADMPPQVILTTGVPTVAAIMADTNN